MSYELQGSVDLKRKGGGAEVSRSWEAYYACLGGRRAVEDDERGTTSAGRVGM